MGFLSVWVFLCIVAGVILGNYFPERLHALGELEIYRVNHVVAVLVWLMIIPMLLKVDMRTTEGLDNWKGVAVTGFINWGVKPFSMALLGWLFVDRLFVEWLAPEQIESYIA